MRIIQSFWSKPSLTHSSSRADGNWFERRYHYMSWALSCLQLKKFHKHVILNTDINGKKILIDTLELPYSEVNLALEILNFYHPDLWVVSKLFSYGLQKEPFLHVDGDFFTFKSFDHLSSEALIAQSKLQLKRTYLDTLFEQITTHFKNLPEYLVQLPPQHETMDFYNPGIFGGTNVELITNYSKECFNLIDANIHLINQNIEYGERDSSTAFGFNYIDLFNTVIESYIFNNWVEKHNQPVTLLSEGATLANYNRAHVLGAGNSYSHPIYYHKKNIDTCLELEYVLKTNYPHYYYKIMSCLEEYQL